MSRSNQPRDPASNALIINNGTGFPQQGSWDWVQLGRSIVSFSVDALSRYCAGKVNPYTLVVAQAMCKIFHLAPTGRRNIGQALAGLTTIGSLSNILHFGFGAESPIHLLVKTEEGSICLALCAALSECYHRDVAVEVLLEIAASFVNVPGEYMPSSLEWKALVDMCSGTLSKASFPLRADHFMCLCRSLPSIGCSEPESIAAALLGIAKLSRKDVHSITVTGGRDAGWIAALAEWLFDLSIIISQSDGTILYFNRNKSDDYQLSIIFYVDDRTRTQLRTSDQTYVLKDATYLFESEGKGPGHLHVNGRLSWEEALSRAYTEDFELLSKNSHRSFGTILGCAASVFRAVSQGDPRVPRAYRQRWKAYSCDTYGSGFVDSATQRFPELVPMRKYMTKACGYDLETACEKYDNAMGLVKSHCKCEKCSETGLSESSASETKDCLDQPAPEDRDNRYGIGYFQTANRYCLLTSTETIISLSLMLARTDLVDPCLRPKRIGFEAAYVQQGSGGSTTSTQWNEESSTMGLITHCLNYEVAPTAGDETQMRRVLELFTGVESHTSEFHRMSACSMDGICVFSTLLIAPSDHSDAVGRLKIMPGQIVFNKKSYFVLRDASSQYHSDDMDRKIASFGPSLASPRLRVKEGTDSLKCMLEFLGDDEFKFEVERVSLRIGPCKLSELLFSRGSVFCKGINCRRVISDGDIVRQDDRTIRICLGERRMTLYSCSSPYQALALLSATEYFHGRYSTTELVDQQCL
jgi:hypothetical protein